MREEYLAAGRDVDVAAGVWVARVVYRHTVDGQPLDAAVRAVRAELRSALGLPPADGSASPRGGPTPRLAVERGRFRSGDRWWPAVGLSAFHLVHYERVGDVGQVESQLDLAASSGCTFVRVFDITTFLYDVHPRHAGHWDALARVCERAAQRGLYVWLSGTDFARTIPAQHDRLAYVRDKARFCREHDNTICEIVNEAWQFGGFSEVDDPRLLELGDIWREYAPLVPYALSSPADGDSVDASEEMLERQKRIAPHVDILNQHPSRKEDPSRWSREVDHIKAMDDIRKRVKPHQPALVLVEPKGCASRRDVPLPNGGTYRRFGPEDADRIRAMLLVGAMVGGIAYHRIPEQDPGTPAIEACRIAARIPCSPDFRFSNAGTPGAPVGRFSGFEKVRCLSDGSEHWVVGYGQHGRPTDVEWRVGGSTDVVFASDQVWLARRA